MNKALPIALGLAVLAGCGTAGNPTSESVPTASSSSSQGAPQSTGGAEPADVKMDPSCDYNLGSGASDTEYEVTATAFLRNVGGTVAKVRVTATWRQQGSKGLVKSKVVTVRAGDEQEVGLSRKVTPTQIDRLQALPTERQCKVDAEVVG